MFWPIFTVIVSVFLFIGTFILNKKIKVEDIDENNLPENCLKCQNQTCLSNLKKEKNINDVKSLIDECNKGEINNG